MPSRGNTNDPAPESDEPPSFSVGRDGKIEGVYRARDQRRSWTPTDTARLELAARPARPAPPEPAPRAQPGLSLRKLAFPIAAVLALLLMVPVARRVIERIRERGRPPVASGLIVIDSVPSNARVFIEGEEVGRTPYVAPNTFQPGTTLKARVVYPGAQDWTGTFRGGVDTSFTAELQAR